MRLSLTRVEPETQTRTQKDETTTHTGNINPIRNIPKLPLRILRIHKRTKIMQEPQRSVERAYNKQNKRDNRQHPPNLMWSAPSLFPSTSAGAGAGDEECSDAGCTCYEVNPEK